MEGSIGRLVWSAMGHVVYANRGGIFRTLMWGEFFGNVGSREGKFGIPYGALIGWVFITPGMCGGIGMGVDKCYLQDGEGCL